MEMTQAINSLTNLMNYDGKIYFVQLYITKLNEGNI